MVVVLELVLVQVRVQALVLVLGLGLVQVREWEQALGLEINQTVNNIRRFFQYTDVMSFGEKDQINSLITL